MLYTHSLRYGLFLFALFKYTCGLNSAYGYTCMDTYCDRTVITNESEALSLGECSLICNDVASVWPLPTGHFSKGVTVEQINPDKIFLHYDRGTPIDKLLVTADNIFHSDINDIIGNNPRPTTGTILVININIQDHNVSQITLETDETYSLQINKSSAAVVQVFLEANTYFGARHGLQTLTQLIIYDDLRNELKILDTAYIMDGPVYPYRGLLIDTSRNFLSVETIKRIIKGMASSKLNRLHWHLTDTQSFPYVSKSHPELSKLGAYAPTKVYRRRDIIEILEYARVRGVRVVPELDTPSHVGAGWQNTGFLTCYNWSPWNYYCVEPPCGQLDPTVDGLYDFLEDLYGDILSDFDPDILHFGGDEVSFTCWNSTPNILSWMSNNSLETTEENYITLVKYYQEKALERVYKKAGREIPIIVWQSQLTRSHHINSAYNSSNVYVQIWANADYPQNPLILENDFKVILSNYDALYLDCGLGDWNTDGKVNWCSPYKSWQMIYNNTPESIAGARKNQVLGQVAAMWTEQTDTNSIDGRVFPRLSAMAEVVWSEPTTDWKMAENRLVAHRQRLFQAGIRADAVVPEWCVYKQETCRTDSFFNTIPNTSNKIDIKT